MNIIDKIEKSMVRSDLPDFNPGDTVKVYTKVKEGEKERIQIFEGVVISKKRGNNRATFIVRKISYGVGVERIFPLHSPSIEKIEVVQEGRVRRAKLYYLRSRVGKSAKIKKKITIPIIKESTIKGDNTTEDHES
jgi:large subunit ribosomal protein L19